MENTGKYCHPMSNLLAGNFTVFLVNAAHVKQLPGRETDKTDAVTNLWFDWHSGWRVWVMESASNLSLLQRTSVVHLGLRMGTSTASRAGTLPP
jgi:hypothetical protein